MQRACQPQYADMHAYVLLDVLVRMKLQWIVMPFCLEFAHEPEQNTQRAFQLLQQLAHLLAFSADKQEVRVRMKLRCGVMPFRLDFAHEPEQNIQRTFQLLQRLPDSCVCAVQTSRTCACA